MDSGHCCSVVQLYPTLHDPMNCSTPGLSGIPPNVPASRDQALVKPLLFLSVDRSMCFVFCHKGQRAVGCRLLKLIDHTDTPHLAEPSAMLSRKPWREPGGRTVSSLKELRVASSQQPVRRQEPRCYCHKERNSGNSVKGRQICYHSWLRKTKPWVTLW